MSTIRVHAGHKYMAIVISRWEDRLQVCLSVVSGQWVVECRLWMRIGHWVGGLPWSTSPLWLPHPCGYHTLVAIRISHTIQTFRHTISHTVSLRSNIQYNSNTVQSSTQYKQSRNTSSHAIRSVTQYDQWHNTINHTVQSIKQHHQSHNKITPHKMQSVTHYLRVWGAISHTPVAEYNQSHNTISHTTQSVTQHD